jgi:hypothetical protein
VALAAKPSGCEVLHNEGLHFHSVSALLATGCKAELFRLQEHHRREDVRSPWAVKLEESKSPGVRRDPLLVSGCVISLSPVNDIVRSEYENSLPQSRHTSYVCPEIVNGRLVLKCQQPSIKSKNRSTAFTKAFDIFVSHHHTDRNVSDYLDCRVMSAFACEPQCPLAQNGLHP